jgi:tetratricopeptide (TPR) repeat protein
MLRRALDIQRQLTAKSPEDANERCLLASAMECMSQVEQARVRFVEARGWLRQALEIQEKLAADDPKSREFRHHLGWLHGRAGAVSVELRNLDDAAGHYAEALKCFQVLYDERPGDHETRTLLASFQDLAGANYLVLNDPRRAAEAYRAALALAAVSPDDSVARRKTAYYHFQLATACRGTGEHAEAVRSFGRSIDLYAALPDAFPSETAYREEIAYRTRDIGCQLRDMGELDASARALTQAIGHFVALAKARPDDATPVRELASSWRSLGDSRRAARGLESACDAIEHAVRLRGQIVAAAGRDAEYERDRLAADRQVLADCYSEHAEVLLRGGNERGAEAAFRSALRAMAESAKAANGLSWLLSTCEDSTLRSPNEAREFAERAVRADPASANFINTLGAALYRTGDIDGAVRTMDEAIGVRGDGNSEDWYFRAMARWKLGERDAARTDFGRAETWMHEHADASRELRRIRDEAARLLGIPAVD